MYLQVQTDTSQALNHERTLDAHAGAGYAYRFDYEAKCTVWSDGVPLPTAMGASHALGIMFMWCAHTGRPQLCHTYSRCCKPKLTAHVSGRGCAGATTMPTNTWLSSAARTPTPTRLPS